MNGIIFPLLLISLTLCQEWNYANGGKDWNEAFKSCGYEQQCPMQITSKSEELDSSLYFLPRMQKKTTGILQLEFQNNILVLNFTENKNSIMGHLMFKLNDSKIRDYSCTAISFHMPAEVTLEGKKFPLEMQVNCTGMKDLNNKENVFISLPVDFTDPTKDEKQTKFFDQFNIDAGTKLPHFITVDNFYDVLDPLTVYDKVYGFDDCYMNIPPCKEPAVWFAVDRTYKINKELYDVLYNLLDLQKNPNGNSREAFEISEDTTVFNYAIPL